MPVTRYFEIFNLCSGYIALTIWIHRCKHRKKKTEHVVTECHTEKKKDQWLWNETHYSCSAIIYFLLVLIYGFRKPDDKERRVKKNERIRKWTALGSKLFSGYLVRAIKHNLIGWPHQSEKVVVLPYRFPCIEMLLNNGRKMLNYYVDHDSWTSN